jgi:integrative and conjugative element protein (TIGR02256 family)
MLEYTLNDDSKLLISDEVVSHLLKYRQLRIWSREAGGQLFATFDGPDVTFRKATGPRRTDRRGRRHYEPDRAAENVEITKMHAEGLHFVGDWHTHPEKRPTPSALDIQSLGESVKRSRHQLNAFFLIVVGCEMPPAGLHVSIHDGTQSRELSLLQVLCPPSFA